MLQGQQRQSPIPLAESVLAAQFVENYMLVATVVI
jgi:hypothetical protein